MPAEKSIAPQVSREYEGRASGPPIRTRPSGETMRNRQIRSAKLALPKKSQSKLAVT